MKLKSFRLESKYLILLLAWSAFLIIPITEVQAVSSTRYYAGYYNYGNNPMGVRGSIYTKDFSTPFLEGFGQWVDIAISYSPSYWVQTGYMKHWIWFFWFFPVLDFYFERTDMNYYCWQTYCILKPLIGHTYTYEIYYQTGGLYCWHFDVYEGQNLIWQGDTVTNPHTYIDLQAFVETTVTGIKIDGSHFSSLKYYTGSNWNLWSTHRYVPDPPYYVQQTSHYEFYAFGGG